MLGREIMTLVNEEKAPGKYSVTFDASELSSGIYFYRLTSGSFNQTCKMILLR
ncbi:MAG: T9SS type A sorting domain-containing protein [Melioribacteraceae bacterium]|nr:T9SS type A sorting domain-containing protein [Melioribacteraceae bacterium]